MFEKSFSEKGTNERKLKYVETLGKSAVFWALMFLGVESGIAQTGTNKKENQKEIKQELSIKALDIEKELYKKMTDKYPISNGHAGISFEDRSSGKKIHFEENLTKAYIDTKEGAMDMRYVDEDGNGQLDRVILNEENFSSPVQKEAGLLLTTFGDEETLKGEIESSAMSEVFSKKIKVFQFKDIQNNPHFVVYDFNTGEYGETKNEEKVYELWIEFQKRFIKSLEDMQEGIEK